MIDFEERIRLSREALLRGDEPLDVNCTGVSDNKIETLGVATIAKIYNDKTGNWQRVELTEYLDSCPICGRLMRVKAITGTTWLAACPEHIEQAFEELEKSRKEMSDNIPKIKF